MKQEEKTKYLQNQAVMRQESHKEIIEEKKGLMAGLLEDLNVKIAETTSSKDISEEDSNEDSLNESEEQEEEKSEKNFEQNVEMTLKQMIANIQSGLNPDDTN